jgi:hypothetical protein
MIKSISKFTLTFILFFILVPGISAQVVNIEKKRKGDQDGFAGALSFGFNLMDNGKNISQFKNTIDLQYKRGASTFILLNDLSFIRVDEDDLVNSGFQHLRYTLHCERQQFSYTGSICATSIQYHPIDGKKIFNGCWPQV